MNFPYLSAYTNSKENSQPRKLSSAQKNSPQTTTKTITIIVVCVVS
jgi:hypothetical protein